MILECLDMKFINDWFYMIMNKDVHKSDLHL